MKIKSPFKDYYDYFFYLDDSPDILIRKTKIEDSITAYPYIKSLSCGYLDFFGECFPVLYRKSVYFKDYHFYWTAEQAIEQIESSYDRKRVVDFFNTKVKSQYMLAFRLSQEIIYCPKLLDTGFPSILPAVEARNIIVKYFAQAKPEKPIPAICDEVMAEIKGFDKFSFRKAKQC